MKLRTTLCTAAAALALQFASAASAATLIVDGSGELTGATGVDVGGTLYDVAFLDGSCVSVFGGCDSLSDFAFTTQAEAFAAGQALVDQVFTGTYDASPALTAGCEEPTQCLAVTPYDLEDTGPPPIGSGLHVHFAGAANSGLFADGFAGGSNMTSADFTQSPGFTWARFTPAQTAVPEPSSWAMMLLGLGAAGLSIRRRRRSQGHRRALARDFRFVAA